MVLIDKVVSVRAAVCVKCEGAVSAAASGQLAEMCECRAGLASTPARHRQHRHTLGWGDTDDN